MAIHIMRGKHGHPIPEGMETLIKDWLTKAGYRTDILWRVRMGAAVKATPHRATRRAQRISTKNTIEVFLKPGGNTTGRVCYIIRPRGIDFGELYEKLKESQDD